MPFDYIPIAAVALDLVTEFGKPVTLRRLDTTPPDPDMPWRGPVDPRATPAATLEVSAFLKEPPTGTALGGPASIRDWVKRAQKIAIIAGQDDLSVFSELVDGSDVWRVVGSATLNPGGTRLITYLGVAR